MREDESVRGAVEQAAAHFGGIDICVNNASAISLTGTLETEMKRYDLMNQVNARGAFLVSKTCLPHLVKAANPHILNLSPPLDMKAKWFAPHVAYSMAKFGMSMCVLGMAEEFKSEGVAVNALWPRTGIATAAVEFALLGQEGMKHCRTPEIMADAAYVILNQPSRACSGNFFIDDIVLYEAGERDFDKYRVDKSKALMPDFFVPDDRPPPPGVSLAPVT